MTDVDVTVKVGTDATVFDFSDVVYDKDTTVTVAGNAWYVVGYHPVGGANTGVPTAEGAVTLLSKSLFDQIRFNNSTDGNGYAGSSVEAYLIGLIDEDRPLAGLAGALADIGTVINPDAAGDVHLHRLGSRDHLRNRSRDLHRAV